ncbi:hypothetical protein PRZ48_009145 [Zasmidium cellare]|uniref:Uncharacterized protein n=1 Tax=Zasmidium cellare TaxID=395010 RepID=A0ABR0EAY3_ZASCE|nr:hypothetical protein PRZ48_009145 [Zasmidium cellare]
MISSVILTAMAASIVSADKLSLYLGGNCNNAILDSVSPLDPGSCIEIGQGQSYVLTKDDDIVYNIYSGGRCSQYEGQITLSGGCSPGGEGITGLMCIGAQSAKRSTNIDESKRAASEKRKAKLQRARIDVEKRVDGDTYQCPNIPSGADYFFVVTTSSAVEEQVGGGDEQTMENDFMAQFNAAYQNPSGQTSVSSYTPYTGDDIDDVTISLNMEQGVIQDIQPQDMESLTDSLMTFRDQQRAPINFLVSLYTGRVDNVGGLIANFRWNGD